MFLPRGVPEGVSIRFPVDLRPLADKVLGETSADLLFQLLVDDDELSESAAVSPSDAKQIRYPFRYKAVDQMLDSSVDGGRSAGATSLGAALIVLAGQPHEIGTVNAGAIAFALLDRNRRDGGCDAHLNLLLLTASDKWVTDGYVVHEAAEAAEACPGDPTPGWLLGQFQSQRGILLYGDDRRIWGDAYRPPNRMHLAAATFERLRQKFPQSADVWAGDGDQSVRTGMAVQGSQPFFARARFRHALQAYEGARRLGHSNVSLGEAQALIGLGETAQAQRLLRTEVEHSKNQELLLPALLAAEETGHNFDAATDTARQVMTNGSPAHLARRTAFLPDPMAPNVDPRVRHGVYGPISTGLGALSPLTIALQPYPRHGGGGSLEDGSPIPTYRPDSYTQTDVTCPSLAWRRAALLSGRSSEVMFASGLVEESCSDSYLEAFLKVETGRSTVLPVEPDSLDFTYDAWQNLWRWAGDLDRALQITTEWAQRSDANHPLPLRRRAEILYLGKRFNEAAATFDAAATLAEDGFTYNYTRYHILVQRAMALAKAGRHDEAATTLRRIDNETKVSLAYWGAAIDKEHYDLDAHTRFALASFHARSLLGDLARKSGNAHAAAEDYEAAITLLPLLTDVPDIHPEVVYNNAALAYLGANQIDSAEVKARLALEADPDNVVSLMTGALVADRAARPVVAAARNQRALANDPEAAPAANDLGVQLARLGHKAKAEEQLRGAVSSDPNFALAWFNLGILHGKSGNLLASQGAYAHAFKLDPTLEVQARTLVIDKTVYETGLDVSKPLPPGWSISSVTKSQPLAAGLVAVLALAIALSRSMSAPGGSSAEKWLELGASRVQRLPVLRRMNHPAWAIGATVATFLLSVAWRIPWTIYELTAYAVGLLIMVAIVMRARVLASNRCGGSLAQQTWAPSVVLSLATGAAGMPLAPLPTATPEPPSTQIHRAAPLTMGVLTTALMIETAWFAVPLTHAFAVACLVMTASLLLPIKPLDGAHLSKGTSFTTVGLLAAAVLVVVGLL